MGSIIRDVISSKKRMVVVLAACLFLLCYGLFLYKELLAGGIQTKALIALAAALPFSTVALFVIFSRFKKNSKAFAVAVASSAFILGLFYMAVFTPTTIPDEPYHYRSAYNYSNILMGKGASQLDLPMRKCDIIEDATAVCSANYRQVRENFDWTSDDVEEVMFPTGGSGMSLSANPPQLRIFSAVGITLGRVLGLGGYPTYYLGRLFNLILFCLLAFASVYFAPRGRSVFAFLILMPMTLSLAASYSYDVGVIGFSFLLTSLCFRALFQEGAISNKLMLGIALAAGVLAPCKVIYSAILLTLFLIPNEKFESKKVAWLFKFGVPLFALITIVLTRGVDLLNIASVPTDAQSQTVEDDSSRTYSYSDILTSPLTFAFVFCNTLDHLGSWYFSTFLGCSLGWFQGEILAPDSVVAALVVFAFVSVLASSEQERSLSVRQRIVFLAISCAIGFLVILSMYFDWTPYGDWLIRGVQGRYFIPFSALVLLALRPAKDLAFAKWEDGYGFLSGMMLVNSFYLLFVFSTAMSI